MRTFVAVVEAGSFTAAADRLGVTVKLVSKYIARLEQDQGMTLLHRTTRSMSLTSEGRAYLDGCRRVLAEVEALEDQLDQRKGLSGTLRVAAPFVYADVVVAKAALAFMEAHPRVTVAVDVSARYVDLAEDGYDLAVRIGELKDSSLIATKLGHTDMHVVAAPSYLQAHGTPARPEDLTAHVCIRDANNPDPDRWPFMVDGEIMQVPVSGPFIANSPQACLLLARAGKGMFLCPDVFLTDSLASGQLVRLLDGFSSRRIGIHAVQLPSAFRKPRAAAFIDCLRQVMKSKAS